uniref:Vesicle transport protein USE1 n=1 Tax=Sander lucioperca TaxID=283035 RepID=A0A8C9YGL7_SANLU
MPVSKTVHMQTKARCTGEMRDELLGTGVSGKGMSETDLRNRRGLPLDERQSAAELEAVLQHHHNLQEKLAEDMLHLARNLKNNTLAAQNIIKQDNQVCECASPQYLHPKNGIEKEEGAANKNDVPDGFNRGEKGFHSQLQFWGSLDHPGTHKHKQTDVCYNQQMCRVFSWSSVNRIESAGPTSREREASVGS